MVTPVNAHHTSGVNGMSNESTQANETSSQHTSSASNSPRPSHILTGLPRRNSQSSEGSGSTMSGSFDAFDLFAGSAHPSPVEENRGPFHTPQRTGTAPPPPRALLQDPRISAAMRTAFEISSRTGKEQGGIISHNPDTHALHVEFRTNGQSHAVDMNRPHVPHGFRVIANYHTHPNREEVPSMAHVNLPPSRADLRNAEARGTPGIVITYPNAERHRGGASLAQDHIDMVTDDTAHGSAFIYGPRERRTPAATPSYPDRAPLARQQPATEGGRRADQDEATDVIRTQLHDFDLARNPAPPADAPRFNGRGRSNSTSDVFTTPATSLDTDGPRHRRSDSLPSGNV